MKKGKNELKRFENMTSAERLICQDDFYNILVNDAETLFGDYFDYKEKPKIVIEKTREGCKVCFCFLASRIKPFNKIP